METSRAETGSSAIINFGSTARARAMAMRCRCPPENSCGYFFMVWGKQTYLAHELADSRPQFQAGDLFVGAHRFRQRIEYAHAGIERPVGFLENHLKIAACPAQLPRVELIQVASFENDRPGSGRNQLHDSAAKRGFAAPDSPTTPSTSPLLIDNDTPSTARTIPRRRLKISPASTGKCVSKPSISRNARGILSEADVTGALRSRNSFIRGREGARLARSAIDVALPALRPAPTEKAPGIHRTLLPSVSPLE